MEEPHDLFLLGIDKGHRDQDIDRGQNICHSPQRLGVDIIENDAGQHVINHIDPCCDSASGVVAKGVVDRFFTAVVHADNRCPGEYGDGGSHEPAAESPVGYLEGHGR